MWMREGKERPASVRPGWQAGARVAALAVLVVSTTGCCVLSPVLSVCAPGGYGGGPRHGGRHLLGEAPQPVSDIAAVASVETAALGTMYVAAQVDAAPLER